MIPPRARWRLVWALGGLGLAGGAPAAAGPSPPGLPEPADHARRWAGEVMRFEVRYMGVVGGHAGSSATLADDGALAIEGWCRNAPWYDGVYRIDDKVRSTWVPGNGSVRYETRFREGSFHQDQDMRLGPDGFEVWRRQAVDGAMKEWTSSYDATPGAVDPVSAFYALRMFGGEGPWTTSVFSGRKTWPLRVSVSERTRLRTVLGDVDVLVLSLRSAHEGDLEQRGRFLLYVTDDTRRIPVRLLVRTNVGPIQADLVEYAAPRG